MNREQPKDSNQFIVKKENHIKDKPNEKQINAKINERGQKSEKVEADITNIESTQKTKFSKPKSKFDVFLFLK